MPERIVCDTGPLLRCCEIGLAEALLATFGTLVAPQAVAAELRSLAQGQMAGQAALLETSIAWQAVPKPAEADEPALQRTDRQVLALALSGDLATTRVLTDDAALRTAATERGLAVTGSLGCLLRAHALGILDRNQTQQAADRLLNHSTLWLDEALRRWLVRQIESLS